MPLENAVTVPGGVAHAAIVVAKVVPPVAIVVVVVIRAQRVVHPVGVEVLLIAVRVAHLAMSHAAHVPVPGKYGFRSVVFQSLSRNSNNLMPQPKLPMAPYIINRFLQLALVYNVLLSYSDRLSAV